MEAQSLSSLCWPSFTASSHDHGYIQKLPATSSTKPLFLYLFPPLLPWISARLLKGERKLQEIIVLGGLEVQLITCKHSHLVLTAIYSSPGLNPLSVSAELVLTYSSGSDGGVWVVKHAWRQFQSHKSKRKFTKEPREAEQSLQIPPLCHHGACSSMSVSTGQGHSSKNKAKTICWVLVEEYG